MMASMTEREASSLGIEQRLRRWYTRVDAGAKANMRPPAEEAEWLQFESHLLPNGDSIGVLKPFTPETAFDGLDTAAIQDLLAQVAEAAKTPDPFRSDVRSNRWVGSLVQEMFGKSKNLAKQVVKTWLENGVLEKFEFDDASRQKRKTGVRPGPKRPGNIHDFNT